MTVSSAWLFISIYKYIYVWCVGWDVAICRNLSVIPLLFKHSQWCVLLRQLQSINAPANATSLFFRWKPTIEKLPRLIWYKCKQMCCVCALCCFFCSCSALKWVYVSINSKLLWFFVLLLFATAMKCSFPFGLTPKKCSTIILMLFYFSYFVLLFSKSKFRAL